MTCSFPLLRVPRPFRHMLPAAVAALVATAALTTPLHAAAKPGEAAPAFTLVDATGQRHALKDHAGTWVVLEWVNFDCPFVRKQYRSGNMPALQRKWRDKGVVWYAVNSSAPGKQGHFEGDALTARIAEEKSAASAYLLDPHGRTGRAYGAKTTPHMFVIDPQGKVVYAGAIDDKPTTRLEDVPGARNYVDEALTLAMAGKAVKTPATGAYGCTVKY
ncbi:MAG TPA: redoxin domain-containing protein [Fibrobacteria bacterium]|jgi:peroxiredoxin|nr:redoxin domain-containing protein [Fibrobacteria bacterium]